MIKKINSLTPQTIEVVQNKGTEASFSGEYNNFEAVGTYFCRQCGLGLFASSSKFLSSCGWPSFDVDISDTVKQQPDQDGHRTEILCMRCDAHLGHVFFGEGLTDKNARYCVNSLSIDFAPGDFVSDTEEAILAAGCFWGVEYYFKQHKGVIKTEVGYIGGKQLQPSYEDVCRGNTGYFEAMRVLYDPRQLSYEDIIKYFFNIHDPFQSDGQGPDRGEQYQSRIFYYDALQKTTAETIIEQLEAKSKPVATKLLPVTTFWPAETYHQDYYAKQHKQPYCHRFTERFK